MPDARANRADETLGRQYLGSVSVLRPPNQSRDDHDIAGGKDPERDSGARRPEDQSSERRTGSGARH
jgi:hypothetical protein